MEIYLVGGAVRDELLGLAVQERDWVVIGANVEEMLAAGFKAVGKDFPVFLHPESNEEYALARTERKKGKGYYGFEVHASPEVSLEEDLLRRDLTINAIAKNAAGELIDPYKGQQDLKAKCIRHVSPAFIEDPLRVLRVARFAAKYNHLGFSIADETLALMQEIVQSNEIKELAAERIWQETLKALHTKTPGIFFDVLHDVGALSQTHAGLNELYASTHARKNALRALKKYTPGESQAELRFAVFVGALFYLKKGILVDEIKEISVRLKLPNALKKLLQLTVTLQHDCHNVHALHAERLLALLQRLDTRRQADRFSSLLKIYSAIHTAINNVEQYPQAAYLQQAASLVDNIDAQAFLKTGEQDKQLIDRLHNERIRLLEEMLQVDDK